MQELEDTSWNLDEAQKNFCAVMKAALGGTPQKIRQAGEEAVVVVSLTEFEGLTKRSPSQSRGSFIDHLLAYPGDEVERLEVEPRPVEF